MRLNLCRSWRECNRGISSLKTCALAVSLSFLKDVALKSATHFTWCLLAAWVCWGFSATSVAFSFFSSSLALGKAVEQTDDKLLYYEGEEHGGKCNRLTKLLNPLAGALFFVGVLFIVAFVALNLP